MPKRFLNIEYSGIKTEVDITEAERLGEVRRVIKEEYGPAMANVGRPNYNSTTSKASTPQTWTTFPKTTVKK
jgi:hypothetical protein